ncbi:uncharacterized protein LOC123552358 [Mercenaria mercenaria]|uniref:uncharacterized protein LOC123552358 n=1 Tax=Mercenaria mercenaria TaxID=6596 RepID=UPI00234F6A2B|nr:uncharacterized protein LOC123552358 [Mercenaria mercenaria]
MPGQRRQRITTVTGRPRRNARRQEVATELQRLAPATPQSAEQCLNSDPASTVGTPQTVHTVTAANLQSGTCNSRECSDQLQGSSDSIVNPTQHGYSNIGNSYTPETVISVPSDTFHYGTSTQLPSNQMACSQNFNCHGNAPSAGYVNTISQQTNPGNYTSGQYISSEHLMSTQPGTVSYATSAQLPSNPMTGSQSFSCHGNASFVGYANTNTQQTNSDINTFGQYVSLDHLTSRSIQPGTASGMDHNVNTISDASVTSAVNVQQPVYPYFSNSVPVMQPTSNVPAHSTQQYMAQPLSEANSHMSDITTVSIVGSSIIRDAFYHTQDKNLQLPNVSIYWDYQPGMRIHHLVEKIQNLLTRYVPPDYIVIHCGGNDIGQSPLNSIELLAIDAVQNIQSLTNARIIWSQILPRLVYRNEVNHTKLNKARRRFNTVMAGLCHQIGGAYIRHPQISERNYLFRDYVHLSAIVNDIFLSNLKHGLR